jgi:hypothetical protein
LRSRIPPQPRCAVFLFLSRTRRSRTTALLAAAAAAAADLVHPAGAHKELKQLVGAVHVDRKQLARARALQKAAAETLLEQRALDDQVVARNEPQLGAEGALGGCGFGYAGDSTRDVKGNE